MASFSKADIVVIASLTSLFSAAGLYAFDSYLEKRTQGIIDSLNSSVSGLEETANNFKDVSEKFDLIIKDIEGITSTVESFICTGEASERLCQTIQSLRENGLPYYGEPKPFNDYMNFRA